MEEIIKKWKKNGKKDHEKNFRYIRFLKGKDSNKVDAIAIQLHKEAFTKIDCLKCGNCCKTLKPVFLETDIVRIATHLNISKEELIEKYLEQDGDGDWQPNTLPCPFFSTEDHTCKVYSVRPIDCEGYPLTHKKGFASRSYSHAWNTVDCPAVFHIVEQMKRIL